MDNQPAATKKPPHGCQVREESWTNWVAFPATMSDDEAFEAAVEFDIFRYGYMGEAGQSYRHNACLLRTTTRVLVLQNGGLDV